MSHVDGTPKSLEEAVERVLALSQSILSANDNAETAQSIIQDFLAQRFGVAMLQNPEIGASLDELFKNITRRVR